MFIVVMQIEILSEWLYGGTSGRLPVSQSSRAGYFQRTNLKTSVRFSLRHVWSAVTCHRFGFELLEVERGEKSPHSKSSAVRFPN
jgi:hypothetical protein